MMNNDPILRRAFLFLEEGNWEKANIYLENVLNQDPENGLAYLGKLMIECQAHTKEELMDLAKPFDTSLNYQRCIRYSDAEIAEELSGYVCYIKERNQIVTSASAYNDAVNAMNAATTEEGFKKAANLFQALNGYDDSASKVDECLVKAEEARRNELYNKADKIFREAGGSAERYRTAAKQFESLTEYFDLTDRITECYKKAEECELADKEAEENRQRKIAGIKKFLKVTIPLIIFCLVAFFGWKWADKEYLRYKPIEQAQVGDYVQFGTYKGQVVSWKILGVGVNDDKNNKLLITEQCIDAQSYNEENKDVTWEDSSLRKWLNNDFYKSTFSKDEQIKISLINSGELFESVSLLTSEEAKKYFNNSNDRICNPSVYAISRGIWFDKNTENCCYWLRTSNTIDFCASSVDKHGVISDKGLKVAGKGCGVRPVIIVNCTLKENLHVHYEEIEKVREEQKAELERQRLALEEERLRREEEERRAELARQAELERIQAEKEAERKRKFSLNNNEIFVAGRCIQYPSKYVLYKYRISGTKWQEVSNLEVSKIEAFNEGFGYNKNDLDVAISNHTWYSGDKPCVICNDSNAVKIRCGKCRKVYCSGQGMWDGVCVVCPWCGNGWTYRSPQKPKPQQNKNTLNKDVENVAKVLGVIGGIVKSVKKK